MKLLLYIALFLPLLMAAQPNLTKKQADSLWAVWSNPQQPDTNRLKAIYDYSWDGYLYTKPDSAFYYAALQYNFAKSKGLKKQMAVALNTQGTSFYIKGDYANALVYHTKSLKIQKEIGNKHGIAGSLNNIGIIYTNQGDLAKAIDNYTRCLKIYEATVDKKGIASSLGNIGMIYISQGDMPMALAYYSKSLKMYEEIGNKKGIANSLGNIGVIYLNQGNMSMAITYHAKSLKIREEIVDKNGIAASLNNIGNIYIDLGDSAYSVGNRRLSVDHYSKAIDYLTQSLKIQEEIGDKIGIANSLNNIGNTYIKQGRFLSAFDYSIRALNMAKEVGAVVDIKAASQSLWEINKRLGKHKEALAMYELYVETRDSILSEENQKEVMRQDFQYNYGKKAAADSVVHAKANEIRDAHIAQQTAEIKAKRNQQYALFGGLFLVLVFAGFMYNRFKVTQKQKGIIEEKEKETSLQKHIIEEKHKEITDSIQYAKRIQSAILPPLKLVKEYLPESFILYKPKDVVAGDFYWMEHKDGKILFAAADCTGHGVPGAMVSVVCNNGLNRSVREHGITDPGKILDKTREIVISEFEKSEDEVKDGMDISLCSFTLPPSGGAGGGLLQWAGANNPLWIIRPVTSSVTPKRDVSRSEQELSGSRYEQSSTRTDNYELIEIKPDKQPIGKYAEAKPFTTHTVDLHKGDSIYVFTDGFQDQFGGPKGKKFKTQALRDLLLSVQNKPMEEQYAVIDTALEIWKGSLEQVDDVCVIGVRI